MSKRMGFGSEVQTPVDRDAPGFQAHVVDEGADERNQALLVWLGRLVHARRQDAQHRMRAGVDEADDTAERLAFAVDHVESDQVDPVVLTIGRAREVAAGDVDFIAAQYLGGVAVVDTVGRRDDALALLAHRAHGQLELTRLGAGGLQIPALGTEQRVGISGVGLHLQPALDAPGIQDAADRDEVVGPGSKRRRRGAVFCFLARRPRPGRPHPGCLGHQGRAEGAGLLR
mmetsp:Transcript_11764/g.27515  ORF Transcript_11764/g.27515 Transcript_11764/m.27515 type:complete len:229 (-) Transcript_11764:2021-2707(-)